MGGSLHITFSGELDLANVEECTAGLHEPLTGPAPLIVLELGDLEFADSTALRMLIDMKRNAEGAGKRLVIDGISPAVLRLFDASGMTEWFEYVAGQAPPVP